MGAGVCVDIVRVMRRDISKLLKDWPFEPGKLNARLIEADDGTPRLQVRLDLGIIQMYLDGRPDGLATNGYPSLLEYHESRFDEAMRIEQGLGDEEDEEEDGRDEGVGGDGDETGGDEPAREVKPRPEPPPVGLTVDDCQALWEEGLQFAHRYIALATLDDHDRVVRDTVRNLRLLDFLVEHGPEDERGTLEQFRPYMILTKHRSLAALMAKDSEPRAAVLMLDAGIDVLTKHYEAAGDPKAAETSGEISSLRELRDAISPPAPPTKRDGINSAMSRAIAEERYEDAAKLRDELKHLKD